MTDTAIVDTSQTDVAPASHAADAIASPDPALQPRRPEGLPDKFWDEARGELRTDALANSYLQLEQKLGAMGGAEVPADPSGYAIEAGDGIPEADPEVNARLHAAGFSQAQAQLVYELAGQYLAPMMSGMAAEFVAQAEQDRLAQHFGGRERWDELSGQIRDWGKANLGQEVYRALSGTAEGVKAIHRMMAEGEPALLRDGHAFGAPESEESLRALMRDPKYWRDHDPAVVARVQKGFQQLYPDPA
jgi:hypothetical protein